MQLRNYVLAVFIVLSTIVTFTDCCSSRVLLAKDHDLKTIDEMSIVASSSTTPSPSTNTSPDDFLPQAQFEKYLQHIKAFINSIAINPNKTQYHNQAALNERNDYSPFDYSYQAVRKNNSIVPDNGEATHPKHNININFHHQYHHYWQQMLQKQQQQQEQEQEVVGEENIADIEKKDSSLATLSTNQYVQRPVSMIRESNVDNINLHFDDVYYTIMKDVLSFACTGQFLTDFCLNKGRCFRYPVGNQSFFSCECADGYVGERCESKSVRGDYEPPLASALVQPRILTARMLFSFPMLLAITVVYLCCSAIVVFKCHPIQMHKHRRSSTRPHFIDP